MEKIGKLTQINRYPVKSMQGEELDKVFVSYSGVTGDRVYSLVNLEDEGKFPWVTMRRQSTLALYQPRFEQELFTDFGSELIYPNPEKFKLTVTTPNGENFDILEDNFEQYLAQALQTKVRIKFSEKGMKDKRPVSLVSQASIDKLSNDLSMPIASERFRMNFLVEFVDKSPSFEKSLVGKTLQIGENVQILIEQEDKRCKIINIDPKTGQINDAILTEIVTKHNNTFGVYCVVLKEGVIEGGSEVFLV